MLLLAKMPQPHQVVVPAMPSIKLRSQPNERFSEAMRPSQPVRHLTSFLKPGADSAFFLAADGLPLRGMATLFTPISSSSTSTPAPL